MPQITTSAKMAFAGRIRLMLRVCAVTTILLTIICLGWAILRQHEDGTTLSPDKLTPLGAQRTAPLSVKPQVRQLIAMSQADRQWLEKQIQPPNAGYVTASLCYHLLHVHGLEGRFSHPQLRTGKELVKLLTDQRVGAAYFGHTTLIRTQGGVRFPTVSSPRSNELSFETHRDQCLATLAQLGLPLSYPLTVDGRRYALRDALHDSLANFHLDQKELAWTGLSYALYLPPRRIWTNRYGEEYSFDDLAGELLERPLDTASCAGTHLVYTLTILARVDDEVSVLSSEVRNRVWSYLKKCFEVAAASQQRNGAWHIDWYRPLLSRPSHRSWSPDIESGNDQLLATSHLAEWMLFLPRELVPPPDEVLQRAGAWLCRELRNANEDRRDQSFCPYAHAAYVVRHVAFVSRDSNPTGI